MNNYVEVDGTYSESIRKCSLSIFGGKEIRGKSCFLGLRSTE